MSGEKNDESPELIAPGPISDSPTDLSEKDMGKEGIPPNSISSVTAVSDDTSGKKVSDQPSVVEQGVYYPPTTYHDYYYPGYNGTFSQPDDKGYYNAASGSYTGIQSDNNSSLLYYYPGYGSYATGYIGADGKPAYSSTEYVQQPCTYGSDVFPSYSYDSTYSVNVSAAPAARSGGSVKPVMGSSGSGKSNGYNTLKVNSNKSAGVPFNSRSQQSPGFSKAIHHNQPLKSLNKLDSNFQKTGFTRGYQPSPKVQTFSSRNPGAYMQYNNTMNFQGNSSRAWNNNYRSKPRENTTNNSESEALTELTRGPRSDSRNHSPKLAADEVEPAVQDIETGKYNLPDFQIEYDDAKFYVIKSYSEDDVHKSIKYDVWSSTPNGNRKLDAAYREADAKMSETGQKCSIFLFFSVNGSGQFVGVAEMIGQVDFSKNMDFWQLDKWNGFFPIKWHIIKDVPNTLLRHIILENNENRAVTYSRDTQEIGLKHGLEMLRIFKNYAKRTCVLDDFNFYENREKSLKAKRNAKTASQANGTKNSDYKKKHFVGGEGSVRERTSLSELSDTSSLVSLTKNLSLGSQSLKSSI